MLQPDLYEYFKGTWTFEREIEIGENKLHYAAATGKCVFSDFPETATALLYEESGKIKMVQTMNEASFFRNFKYQITDAGLDIYFHDLLTQKFGLYQHYIQEGNHELIAKEIHVCSKDLYNGHFLLESDNRFMHTTRIDGPAKDYFIETIFTKQA